MGSLVRRALDVAAAAATAATAAASLGSGRPDLLLACVLTCCLHCDAPDGIQGLQAALDACSRDCGVVLVDRPSAYLTATLSLTGCVTLSLPRGVTLLAGDRVRVGNLWSD